MTTAETITGAEMARRMRVTDVQFAALIAGTGRRPNGPNRAQRRAARRSKKEGKR